MCKEKNMKKAVSLILSSAVLFGLMTFDADAGPLLNRIKNSRVVQHFRGSATGQVVGQIVNNTVGAVTAGATLDANVVQIKTRIQPLQTALNADVNNAMLDPTIKQQFMQALQNLQQVVAQLDSISQGANAQLALTNATNLMNQVKMQVNVNASYVQLAQTILNDLQQAMTAAQSANPYGQQLQQTGVQPVQQQVQYTQPVYPQQQPVQYTQPVYPQQQIAVQ